MRLELAPHQPRLEDKESAKAEVVERLAELDVGFDLSRHPELLARLAEIGPHFEDSLEMVGMVKTLYPRLREALGLKDVGPERLMLAAVLHDVGKSGPPGPEGAFHAAVQRLFVPPVQRFNPYRDNRAKTISEFADEQGFSDAEREEIFSALEAAGVAPDREPMVDFWRRHAAWTYEILQSEAGPDLDADLGLVAASHHLLEGQNPAGLDLKHVPAEAHVLEVLASAELIAAVDKYQAYRSRGGLAHEAAVAQIRRALEARPDLPEPLIQKFRAILDVIDQARDALEQPARRAA